MLSLAPQIRIHLERSKRSAELQTYKKSKRWGLDEAKSQKEWSHCDPEGGLSADHVNGNETGWGICGKEQEAVSTDHVFEKSGQERKEENA